jgi:superkiller protein 3
VSTPVGALQLNLPNESWKDRILPMAQKAECIVVVVAGTPGLKWEFDRLAFQSNLRSKMVLLLPPFRPDETNAEWPSLLDPTSRWQALTSGATSVPRIPDEKLQRAAAIAFSVDGSAALLTAKEASAAAFRLALQLARILPCEGGLSPNLDEHAVSLRQKTFAAVAGALVCFAVALSWASLQVHRLQDVQALLDRGASDFGNGRYEEAVNDYQKALAINSNSPVAHYKLGLVLTIKGSYDRAAVEVRKAIRLMPDAAFHDTLGTVLSHQGKYEEATSEYEKAIALDPDLSRAHSNLCGVYLNRKLYDAAIVECEKSIDLDPNTPLPHVNLGLIFLKTGKYPEAIAQCDRALYLDPNVRGAKEAKAAAETLAKYASLR